MELDISRKIHNSYLNEVVNILFVRRKSFEGQLNRNFMSVMKRNENVRVRVSLALAHQNKNKNNRIVKYL